MRLQLSYLLQTGFPGILVTPLRAENFGRKLCEALAWDVCELRQTKEASPCQVLNKFSFPSSFLPSLPLFLFSTPPHLCFSFSFPLTSSLPPSLPPFLLFFFSQTLALLFCPNEMLSLLGTVCHCRFPS